jgi:hypothetical protein
MTRNTIVIEAAKRLIHQYQDGSERHRDECLVAREYLDVEVDNANLLQEVEMLKTKIEMLTSAVQAENERKIENGPE